MSLLDALLLDPYRINVWIAYRIDGVKGTGTQSDPYDGSTAAKLDALMSGMAANTCVHLGPNPTVSPYAFQTAGYCDGPPASGWQPKSGMRIVGSGIDVTTLKLVSAATGTQGAFAVGHPLSASTVDHFELSGLTIDCNWSQQSGASVASGAVRIMGNHSRVVRVKVKNWGVKTGGRAGFVIAMLTGDPTVGVNGVTSCGIEECIVVVGELGQSAVGPVTVLHVGGRETAASPDEAFGVGPYIRNCFVDCEQAAPFTKEFRALSMAWCKGGVVEGNQVHNTKCGGPYQTATGAHERFRGKFVVGCVARNQPRKNIPALVKAPADVTVLPSGGEGFGLPIIESFAAGVPVVATDCSACSELVRGRGELVRVLTTVTAGVNLIEHAVIDIEDLAGRIERLCRDPELVRQYSVAGRVFAESLSWDDLIPQWLELIRSAAGAGIAGRG